MCLFLTQAFNGMVIKYRAQSGCNKNQKHHNRNGKGCRKLIHGIVEFSHVQYKAL